MGGLGSVYYLHAAPHHHAHRRHSGQPIPLSRRWVMLLHIYHHPCVEHMPVRRGTRCASNTCLCVFTKKGGMGGGNTNTHVTALSPPKLLYGV